MLQAKSLTNLLLNVFYIQLSLVNLLTFKDDIMNKTNAMRQLDKAKISYETVEYEVDESDLSGMHIAEQTGLNPNFMFKTLIAKGEKRGPLVFCIP